MEGEERGNRGGRVQLLLHFHSHAPTPTFSWNNITWPAPAAALVSRYRSQYNVRFGGIRKPRLGNSDLLVMAQSKGWLMGQVRERDPLTLTPKHAFSFGLRAATLRRAGLIYTAVQQ